MSAASKPGSVPMPQPEQWLSEHPFCMAFGVFALFTILCSLGWWLS